MNFLKIVLYIAKGPNGNKFHLGAGAVKNKFNTPHTSHGGDEVWSAFLVVNWDQNGIDVLEPFSVRYSGDFTLVISWKTNTPGPIHDDCDATAPGKILEPLIGATASAYGMQSFHVY